MTDLTNFNPYYANFDFAGQFILPKKRGTSIYEPTNPDYASMLTSLFKSTVTTMVYAQNSHGRSFNPVTYTLHFFLALLFTSNEKNTKKLGIKGAYWRLDVNERCLEMFIICDKDNDKKLILKRINFDGGKNRPKHEWSEESMRTVASYLTNGAAMFKVESHWYEVIIENMPRNEDLATSPLTYFTLDINENVDLMTKLSKNGFKSKKKSRTIFHKVSTDKQAEIFSNRAMLMNLGSKDGKAAEEGTNDLLQSIVKIFKRNFYDSLIRELDSYRTDSQCGFVHGILLSLQTKLSWKVIVEQTYRMDNPGLRIQVTKYLGKSWNDLMDSWPLQVDLWPSLDLMEPADRHDVRMPISQHKPSEVTFNTLNPQYIYSSLNINGKGNHFHVVIGRNLKPDPNFISTAREKAAIKLDLPIVKQLNDLNDFLQSELMYTSKIYKPFRKSEKLNFLSRYIHGYLISDPAAKEGAVFRIELNNPTDMENKYLKTFLIKTTSDTKDLVINVFEHDQMLADEINRINDLLKQRQYPRTNDLVTHTVLFNLIASPLPVNRPEYSTFAIPSIKTAMKSASPVSKDTWTVRKMEFFDLVGEVENLKSEGTEERISEDKPILQKISNYFSEHFSYITNRREMEALLQGILHNVKIITGMLYFRKNLHQVAFLDRNKKLNIINFSHGPLSAATLADTQEFFRSGVIDGFQDVKTLNLLMLDNQESHSKIKAVPNSLLTVFSLCRNLRAKRSALCSNDNLQTVLAHDKADADVIAAKRKHLANFGKISSGIMTGLMAKDFISEMIRGDYVGMAVNAGFLISNVLSNKLAEKLLSKALSLESKTFLASALKLGSPFLSRCPSFAFVGFDLYKSIVDYQNHEPESLVSVGTDSAYIALDLAETAIEVSEAFGIIGGVSAITGPVGWTIGATLLLSTDIYKSIKAVQRIDNAVHLTKTEKFTEGIRSFFGMDPEKHVRQLMTQKNSLSAAVANMTAFLRQQPLLKRYIFPIALNRTIPNIIKIDFKTKRPMKMTRPLPELSPKFSYFCLPTLNDDYADSITLSIRFCHNSIGLEDNSDETKSLTYVQLPDGDGTVLGMKSEDNFFDVTGAGYKTIEGGSADDTFLIRNDKARGFLNGWHDHNVLDFSGMQSNVEVEISAYSIIFDGREALKHKMITGVVGRNNSTDRIYAWCSLKDIDLLGGKDGQDEFDLIAIAGQCEHNLTVMVRDNTRLVNSAPAGIFSYIVADTAKDSHIEINKGNASSHSVMFKYASYQFTNFLFKRNESKLEFILTLDDQIKGIVVFPWLCPTCHMIFNDGVLFRLTNGEYLLNVTSSAPMDDLAVLYANFVEKFDISVFIHSTADNRSLSLNRHSMRNNSADVHAIDVVYSNSHGQIFQSAASELIYVLEKIDNSQSFSKIILMNEKIPQKVVIDFQALISETDHYSFDSFIVDNDIVIQMTSSTMSNLISGSIILANAMKHRLYQNVVVRTNTIMTLKVQAGSVQLIDNPLSFDQTKNLIVVSPKDNIAYGSSIHFNFTLENYDCFQLNRTHLILTNALLVDMNAVTEDYFSLMMINFFTNKLMQSLKLEFSHKNFSLEAKTMNIQNCRPMNYMWPLLSAID